MRRAMLVMPLVLLLIGGLEASFIERFSIDAGYGCESWKTDLADMKTYLSMEDTSFDYPFTGEDIALENEAKDFYNRVHNFGLDIGFEAVKGLELNAGAGLAVIQLETREVYGEGIDTVVGNLIDTKEPGFYVKGGLEFRLPVYRALFIAASPEVYYTAIRDMNYVDPEADDIPASYELLDRKLSEDVLAWEGSVLAGLDLGWISPYIGGRYQGFRQHVEHDQTFLDLSEETRIYEEDLYFAPSFWAAGIAGLSFSVARNTHLVLEGSMGKGFSISSRLEIGL